MTVHDEGKRQDDCVLHGRLKDPVRVRRCHDDAAGPGQGTRYRRVLLSGERPGDTRRHPWPVLSRQGRQTWKEATETAHPDRVIGRQAQGRAPHRHPLRQVTAGRPLCRRGRCNRHAQASTINGYRSRPTIAPCRADFSRWSAPPRRDGGGAPCPPSLIGQNAPTICRGPARSMPTEWDDWCHSIPVILR